jgi:hypothetical protein
MNTIKMWLRSLWWGIRRVVFRRKDDQEGGVG